VEATRKEDLSWFERLDNKYLIRWLRKPPSHESYKSAYKELKEITGIWPSVPEDSADGREQYDQESVLDEVISDDEPQGRKSSTPRRSGPALFSEDSVNLLPKGRRLGPEIEEDGIE